MRPTKQCNPVTGHHRPHYWTYDTARPREKAGKPLDLRAFCEKPRNGFFWVNNDYDRYHAGTEDDLRLDSQMDCDYTSGGNRAIPCPRDLEDYARLWICGVTSNVLSALPSGSTITLSWQNNSGATIDLFQAADADGGIGYLTNGVTATNQINNSLCRYMGRLGPGQSIQLNASTFSNNWAGDHYIWCGVSNGMDQLNLTITDGSSNVLAQSSQFIQLQDIKQMYERWTVGDAPTVAPLATAIPATDNFTPGYPKTAFVYPYNPSMDTNDNYILYVHGWNMPPWEKDRWAETAYKRLYWQGYQGRFGIFRWPCNLLKVFGVPIPGNYDISEQVAWQCGQPLETFMAGLNSKYPGKVYVLAHSMGNIVTGEALRLAGSNFIVNTYVASQAAVSARAYDNTIPADATNSYGFHYVPDFEGHYFTNGASPYFNGIIGAAHFADFYNFQDYALDLWITDQSLKPDNSYYYETPTSSHPSGNYQQIGTNPYRNLAFGANTYEIFARITPSYSLSLGAETNVPSIFGSTISVNLGSETYNFGSARVGHSLQFRSDNTRSSIYWDQLLLSFSLKNSL